MFDFSSFQIERFNDSTTEIKCFLSLIFFPNFSSVSQSTCMLLELYCVMYVLLTILYNCWLCDAQKNSKMRFKAQRSFSVTTAKETKPANGLDELQVFGFVVVVVS